MRSDSATSSGRTYPAPWGTALRWTSLGLVAFAILISSVFGSLDGSSVSFITLCPTFILVLCLFFVVRSYEITRHELLIHRLLWTTRLPLAGLKSAEAVPRAMSGSLRTCGNGGGFSFTGWYWSKALGHYRAFVTDMNRTVVLRFEKRTVVVSPAGPEEFVRQLTAQPS